MVNFYKPDNIKKNISITRYLKDQGIDVVNGRAVATWRDGSRKSVSVNEEKGTWFDHVEGIGGSVIDLFMRIENSSLPFLAICETLGDRYGLTPDKTAQRPKASTHGEQLVADGFKLVKSYCYRNEDGTPRYYVDRYEKYDESGKRIAKEFSQHGPDSDNLRGIERTIYNLPEVIAAETVYLVEGEKDCDTLASIGLTATTNSGGATYWNKSFNEIFSGKNVVMLLDNDEKGQKRIDVVGSQIFPFVKSLKTLTLSNVEHHDVTDWINEEGGTLQALLDLVRTAGTPNVLPPDICAAKAANENPLRNYKIEYVDVVASNGKTKTKEVKSPRPVDEICEDISTRFLGFPKCIGTELFDYVRADRPEDKKIITLVTSDDLKAWINGTSHHQSDFVSGPAFCTYKELQSRLLQTRTRYDVIAKAPWYPAREDAFAAYDALPEPDETGSVIDELMSYFCPATPEDEILMRAFFMSPMFNTDAARPAWIIDTVDAQASGKTTVVKACGWIYGEDVIDLDLKTLEGDITVVKKRVLSSDGRTKRIALFDNVTTSLKSGNLANLITAQTISGMRPYGHGEETRKNDITWCATVNGAIVDTDMATRSYFIKVKSPGENADPLWEKKLRSFIDRNRPLIQSTYMADMRNAKIRRRNRSRFGEFDSVVLSAACKSDEEFNAVDRVIVRSSESSNDDSDLAAQCVEAILNALSRYDQKDTHIKTDMICALKCSDVDEIMRRTSGGCRNWTSRTVRRFVNGGHIKEIIKGIDRIETSDGKKFFGKARCFLFHPSDILLSDREHTQYISFDNGIPKVIGIGKS